MERRMDNGFVYAISAVLLWSTVASAFKITLRFTPPEWLVVYSTLVSAVVLWLVVLLQGKFRLLRELTGRDIAMTIFAGFLNPCAYYLVLFYAYDLLPAQEAQPLNYTWAIVLSIFSAIILGERLSFKMFAGLLVSFCGVLVIATRGEISGMHFASPVGVGLAVGSSLIWASYWVLNMKSRIDRSLRLALGFSAGFVFSLLIVYPVYGLHVPGTAGIAGCVYIGVFEMGITFLLWDTALKRSSSTARTANLIYISPFLSLVWIHLMVGEIILASSIGGLVLITGGIVLQRLGRPAVISDQ